MSLDYQEKSKFHDKVNKNVPEKINTKEKKAKVLRGKYNVISDEIKKRIFQLYDEGESLTSISKEFNLPRSTIVTFCRKYSKMNGIVSKKRGGDHRSLFTSEQKEQIYKLVDLEPTMTLRNIKQKILDTIGISCSLSTINRVLRDFHFKLHYSTPVFLSSNTDNLINLRYQYAIEYKQLKTAFGEENFIFVDEVDFNVVSRTKRAMGKKDHAKRSVSMIRNWKFSVKVACTKNKMLYYEIQRKIFNEDNSSKFLNDLENQCIQIENPLLIVDKAKTQLHQKLEKSLNKNKFQVLYLPPDSPFLNPIENVFVSWKNEVNKIKIILAEDLLTTITDAFKCLDENICDISYCKMLEDLERILERENFVN